MIAVLTNVLPTYYSITSDLHTLSPRSLSVIFPQIFPWKFKKATYINLAALLGLWHLPIYTGAFTKCVHPLNNHSRGTFITRRPTHHTLKPLPVLCVASCNSQAPPT